MQQPLDTNQAKSAGYSNLPQGAEGHFLLHFYAVIARLLANLCSAPAQEAGEKYFEQFPFLSGYQRMLRSYIPDEVLAEEEGSWWDSAIEQWEKQSPYHLPLQALRDEAGLSIDELRVLLAAGI